MATLSYGVAGGSIYEAGRNRIVEVANGDWYLIGQVGTIAIGFQTTYLYWRKSSDQGRTWGKTNTVEFDFSTAYTFGVWYDRWTPGDSGNLIHIAYQEASSHDVRYRNLDVSSDTLSSATTVHAGTSANPVWQSPCEVVKTVGGKVRVVFNLDGGTEHGHYAATTPFTSWTSRASPVEADFDPFFLLPGNYADNHDTDLYLQDVSANGWSRKVYDDSANSWAETAIITDTNFIDGTVVVPQANGAVKLSSGLQYLAAWNDYDTATADLKFWTWDGTTLTAKTDVVSNSDDCGACAVAVDNTSGRVYVFYIGKSDGSETIPTAVKGYYKYTDDDGTTWSAEQTLFSGWAAGLRMIDSALVLFNTSSYLPVALDEEQVHCLTTAYQEAGGGGLQTLAWNWLGV